MTIPTILATPPWVPARKKKKLSLADLAPPREERVTWKPGEQEEWAKPATIDPAQDPYAAMSEGERDRAILKAIASRGILPIWAGRHLSKAGLVEALACADKYFIDHYGLAHVALARHGLEMIEPLVALFDRAKYAAFDCMRHIDSPRIAARIEAEPVLSEEWFAAYPSTAAWLLVPKALTASAKDATRATKAIARLIAAGHERAVFEEAERLGEDAVLELRALFDPPPLPPKPPAIPSFVDMGTLPPPKLRSGEPLGPEHVERLLQLLVLLPLGAAKAAVRSVKDACDPESLGDLSRILVDRWVASDAPTKDKWVLVAAGVLGDDLVAHQLADRIAAWAVEGHHTRAAAGVEALRELGTDAALAHLVRFAEKSKAKAVKKRARAELEALREEMGLDEESLADRVVPDLGFDARGELSLSYGARAFRVVFDETLTPVLTDGDRPLRSLPKPSAKDDARLAERAQATWKAVKTEAKSLLDDAVRRLERATAKQRRWTHDDFERHLRRHPLVQHLARRLVWTAHDASGAVVASFRIDESGALANVDDEAIDVDPSLTIGLAHPLLVGRDVAERWGNVFGDYRIVQPFPQLAREVFTLDERELGGASLDRWTGAKVEGSRFFGLRHRGWELVDYEIGKRLSGGLMVVMRTMPGLGFLATKPEDQTIEKVELRSPDGSEPTFRTISPLEASEVVRDIEMLRR